MIVFDASGPVGLCRDGCPKIDIAREAVASVLPDVSTYLPNGLVAHIAASAGLPAQTLFCA